MNLKNNKKEIIRTSRKSYIPFYIMTLIILGVIIYIKLNNLPLNRDVFIASMIFIFFVIKLTEVHRITHHYDITPTALEKVEGIFFKKIKRMNYGAISQLHLSQSPWNKLLNIGTIEIAQFSETIRTEIKNIDKPREVLHEISKKMIRKE